MKKSEQGMNDPTEGPRSKINEQRTIKKVIANRSARRTAMLLATGFLPEQRN